MSPPIKVDGKSDRLDDSGGELVLLSLKFCAENLNPIVGVSLLSYVKGVNLWCDGAVVEAKPLL